MGIELSVVIKMLFGDERARRYTQDSPILPEVWLKYFEVEAGKPVDLLLTPHRNSTPGALRNRIGAQLKMHKAEKESALAPAGPRSYNDVPKARPLVYNETHVVAELWFEELIRYALPLTKWWKQVCWRDTRPDVISPALLPELLKSVEPKYNKKGEVSAKKKEYAEDLLWFLRLVGLYKWQFDVDCRNNKKNEGALPNQVPKDEQLLRGALKFLDGMAIGERDGEYLMWSASLNRIATPALHISTATVKGDAARNLFKMSCKNLCWAIVDGGIDAKHPAFVDREKMASQKTERSELDYLGLSRVVETYDFTKMRNILDPDSAEDDDDAECVSWGPDVRRRMKELKTSFCSGRMINWEMLKPFLCVQHDHRYVGPGGDHGTHVAGILGSDWQKKDTDPPPDNKDLIGMCPDIKLFDLRVLDDKGEGSDFTVLAALQFIRHLNSNKDMPVIHGANLSLSIPHDVKSAACGQSPVCEECERLIGNGVVVVVAAGNQGYTGKLAAAWGIAEYQDISITDPGNAENVITVGSTHREMPHKYGVSYFSSRGPTGDGRLKPDIVAPGEKIKSTIPGRQIKAIDGTSMAAPHVSGAAALLIARHNELIGRPLQVKQILCKTATDLGRLKYFQGAGLVDVLRAIQCM